MNKYIKLIMIIGIFSYHAELKPSSAELYLKHFQNVATFIVNSVKNTIENFVITFIPKSADGTSKVITSIIPDIVRQYIHRAYERWELKSPQKAQHKSKEELLNNNDFMKQSSLSHELINLIENEKVAYEREKKHIHLDYNISNYSAEHAEFYAQKIALHAESEYYTISANKQIELPSGDKTYLTYDNLDNQLSFISNKTTQGSIATVHVQLRYNHQLNVDSIPEKFLTQNSFKILREKYKNIRIVTSGIRSISTVANGADHASTIGDTRGNDFRQKPKAIQKANDIIVTKIVLTPEERLSLAIYHIKKLGQKFAENQKNGEDWHVTSAMKAQAYKEYNAKNNVSFLGKYIYPWIFRKAVTQIVTPVVTYDIEENNATDFSKFTEKTKEYNSVDIEKMAQSVFQAKIAEIQLMQELSKKQKPKNFFSFLYEKAPIQTKWGLKLTAVDESTSLGGSYIVDPAHRICTTVEITDELDKNTKKKFRIKKETPAQKYGEVTFDDLLAYNLPERRDTSNDKIMFKDVIGQEQAKESLRDIVNQIKDPAKYATRNIKPLKGLLFYGGPGTGKTLLARALANEANCAFIAKAGSEFDGAHIGESAANVRRLFDEARELSEQTGKPCIIFIDEIDALLSKRGGSGHNSEIQDQKKNEFLAQMDGFGGIDDKIIVIGATNSLEKLDEAAIRSGRFDDKIEFTNLTLQDRIKLLTMAFNKRNMNQINIEHWARKTNEWSGAALENFVNQSARKAADNYTDFPSYEDLNLVYNQLDSTIKKTEVAQQQSNQTWFPPQNKNKIIKNGKILPQDDSKEKKEIFDSTRSKPTDILKIEAMLRANNLDKIIKNSRMDIDALKKKEKRKKKI